MSGWEVGDLALCLDSRPHARDGTPNPCKKGCVYTVSGIVFSTCGTMGLQLEGVTFPRTKLNADVAARFRKIKPDTEPCEEEFTVLIKRGRKVSA